MPSGKWLRSSRTPTGNGQDRGRYIGYGWVTNMLLEGASQAVDGKTESVHQIAQRLRTNHNAVLEALLNSDLARQAQVKQEVNYLVGEFVNLCQAISVLEKLPRAPSMQWRVWENV